MNRIFKVIWSKTKNCYVVASELAKGRTKAASTGDKAKRLALAAITALMLLPVGGYSYAADTTTVKPAGTGSTTVVEVYTKEGTDKQIEAANKYTYRKAAELNKKLTDQKTSTALHISSSGDLIVGTKENYTVKDMEIRGKLTSGSISTGGITSTGDVTVAGKMAADGVTDETTKDGTYVKQNNTVGNNLVSLDKQVKANDDRITNVKEYLEQQTSDKYVSKADAAVQDGAIVKAANTIGDNVTKLDAALASETAARIGADKAQDKVIQAVNDNLVQSVTTINKNVADGFTALNQAYANEAAAREAKDNELNERITNEANAIHDEIKAGDEKLNTRITNVKEYLEQQTSDKYVSKADAAVQDGAIVKANKTIGENVTNLDAALASETAARIGADKAQDKVIQQVNQNMVDGFNTINTNMANGFAALNAADAAEKEARIGADKKLAEAVNSGLSLSDDNVLQKNTTTVADDGTVTTSKSDANEMILNKGNKNQITLNEKGIKVGTNSSVMDADGIYTGGDTFDAAKAAMSSDGQIKGANGKFTVDASGNTTVTSLDAGTGTIQTKGDLYAKDATFSGDITAKDATLSGDLSAKDGTFSGDLSAKDGTFSGDVSAKDVTATGTLQGAEVTDGTATLKQGKLTGVKDIETEALHVNGDANVTGKLTTKDLEVTGEFNANTLKSRLDENNYTEIHGGNVTSKNLKVDKGVIRTSESSFDENGREEYVTDNDSRATVKVGANEISQTLDDKGDTSEKQSTFRQRIDQILQEIKSANGSTSVEQTDVNITNTAKNGTITNDAQNLVNKASDSITSQIGDGSAVKSVMDANGIANTATGGTISNSAADVINTGTNSVINQVGDNQVAVKTDSVKAAYGSDTSTTWDAKGITNTTSGDISNSAANISNTTTGNMTNTVGGNLIDTIMGTSTTTVTGKVTEDYKSDLSTKVGGDETHAVTGNQTTTVSGNRTVNVKGTETENFNALETNVKTDQKTSVGGNQTNIVGGDQQNTVSGSKTETVKGSVTEKYGSQATTVDGDQSTNIGGNQTTVVAKDQTNTVSGNKTETVKGAVNETYGSQTTKVNGDQSTTVTGKQTNIITGDQVNTIGGSQTTTVTGDSSLSAQNITNTASEKITNQIGDGSAVKSEMTADGITNTAEGGTIYNKSKDILNEASGDILNFADGEIGNVATKITNITGDNTVTSDTNGTTFENKAHNTAIKEGTVTKTTISGNTIETGQATMDYAEVMKDLGVHGNATVDQKLTVKGDSDLQGNANVGKNLTVNGTSDLKGNVTMESNATVQKDLTVNGTTTTNKLVVNNGATIKGGTTTDTLHVTSSSTFDGAATFKDVVTMEKDLSVGGNATVAGSMTASSYKVGDKTYISESGINANNQKVVNVAAGDLSANSTDAVNGAQLYQTNERVTGVENKVNKLDSRVDKVGANAAALANLHPLEFDADSKWNIAAAVGGYKGETATAIGAFYRPNENVMVNVSSSFGTGENMYGGGISLRIGQGGNKARRNATNGLTEREKAMQKQIDSLTSRLDALLSVINPNMSKDFPDVPENHWAYEAVSRLAGNGVIQGYEDGKYHGDRTMTRYEMAEIIYNALSKGAKAEKKLVEEFKPELQAMAAQKKA
ncbi:ESPR-type extended signal peptide-containing protein [Megasphaera elsdenii]|uniref:ESPR-type extended signal peptide-containing protein n=1 Tax=Megasphaera elsdenii TaxID=907 RepID=UPI000688D203|nr:ESPR-type extended signal peptide-containing protein [Megasphaera elsdenii]